jgi:outer membrane protein assembly factor BamB
MELQRLILASLLLFAFTGAALAADWPAWRGPAGNGTTTETGLPEKWSQAENVAWKVPLPGPGNSTPVVFGDRVYLTCASDKGAVRSVLCFDRASGKELWRRDTKFTGEEPTHDTNPFCSASPVTDGKRVFAWHGSAGVVAYTAEGQELWRRDLGPFRHIWGNASSPVLFKETVILNLGPGPESRLVALKAKDGTTLWENPLPEAKGKNADEWKGSWGTPLIHYQSAGGAMMAIMVLGLPQHVAAFDPTNGKEIWRCRGLSDLVYTSPVIGNGVVVAMSGYGGPAIGLRLPDLGTRGDVTDSHRLWREEKNQQRVGSGVSSGEHCYIVNEPGIALCIELKTGKPVWRERVAGTTWSSAVLAGDRVYATDQTGETVVFRASPQKLELLHRNELGEMTRASPAVSDGQVFIRTYKHLYCIGTRKPSGGA